jgi:hypothetical protein
MIKFLLVTLLCSSCTYQWGPEPIDAGIDATVEDAAPVTDKAGKDRR